MRIKLLGWIDVLIVDNGDDIRWLNAHPDIVRPPNARAGLLQWIINRKTLGDLSFGGTVLPVFVAREDVPRGRRQAELADALDEPARAPKSNSEWLGAFVAGVRQAGAATREEVGVYVQDWCGRLFDARYKATPASYEAGRVVAEWPSAPPWRAFGKARQRLDEAKRVVAEAAGNDIHAVHATSIGMENITRSVRSLRALARRAGVGSLSPEEAILECLFVPPILVRGCRQEIHAPFLRAPLRRNSLVVFRLAHAFKKEKDLDLAFLEHSWSACPARHVVPAMLESVWRAAVAAHEKEHMGWQLVRQATGIAKSISSVVGNGASGRRASAV